MVFLNPMINCKKWLRRGSSNGCAICDKQLGSLREQEGNHKKMVTRLEKAAQKGDPTAPAQLEIIMNQDDINKLIKIANTNKLPH